MVWEPPLDREDVVSIEIARSNAIWRRLRERLAYHQAKLAEERAAKGD